MKHLSFLAILTLCALLVACPSRPDLPPDTATPRDAAQDLGDPVDPDDIDPLDAFAGIDLDLLRSDRGEPLSDPDLEALFARLPELEEDDHDELAFLHRPETIPLPRVSESPLEPWPPDLTAAVTEPTHDGPPQLQAYRPTGEVPSPFQVTVAFDRPLGPLGATTEESIPDITITPDVPGRWRWLGTQALTFQPTDGFPGATDYTVEYTPEAGADAESFSFSTVPPRAISVEPNRFTRFDDQPVLIIFDQAVHPDTAESVTIDDGEPVPTRLLSRDEKLDAFPHLSRVIEEDRTLGLAPERPYQRVREVAVDVSGPIRSQEGPRLGTGDLQHTFRLSRPMRVVNFGCDRVCRPSNHLSIRFSESLHSDTSITPGDITIRPRVPNLSTTISSSHLILEGDFRANTTYEITLPEGIRDVYGREVQGTLEGTATFGDYGPAFGGPSSSLLIRPPGSRATLPVAVRDVPSFRKRVYRVTPEQWGSFQRYRERQREFDARIPFSVTYENTRSFNEGQRQRQREIDLNLRRALDGDRHGHVVVVIDEPDRARNQGQFRRVHWVQFTDLSADITDDGQELAVRVTRISNGAPVSGAEVTAGNAETTTDDDGEALLRAPSSSPVVVQHGQDTLVVPPGGNLHGRRGWQRRSVDDQEWIWSVVDDRQTYRPGESAHIRGWIRLLDNTPDGGLNLPPLETVSYRLIDAQSNDVTTGRAELDRFGGFELTLNIPEGANLGDARLVLETSGKSHTHSITVREFRRPEYEVTLEGGAGPHLAQSELRWDGQATYYAGGALPNAPAQWTFQEERATYRPPGWSGFSFGPFTPQWWRRHQEDDDPSPILPRGIDDEYSDRFTDHSGQDIAVVPLEATDDGLPRTVSATLSVRDVNRQRWSASHSALVHPARAYVGLRSPSSTFIRRTESFDVDLIATTIDGDPAEGLPIQTRLFREHWQSHRELPDHTCEFTSTEEPQRCSFSRLPPGRYRVQATVTDEEGRIARSEQLFWVAGTDRRSRALAREGELFLVPDQNQYDAGQTARLFVQAPSYPLDAIVELRRDGRFDRRLQRITANDPYVEIDLNESMIPNVHVAVLATSTGRAYDPTQFYSGQVELSVDSAPRRLSVEVLPSTEAVSPGSEITVEALVRDHQGTPVEDAQVLLFAVDEAILALSGYDLPDMVSTFYPTREAHASEVRSRQWILLEAAFDRLTSRRRPPRRPPPPEYAPDHSDSDLLEAAGGSASTSTRRRGPPPISVREVFNALAFYRSDLITDEDGRVRVDQQLPESLTRYRLMAIAVDDSHRFGGGESHVTARQPLMVRPSPPRFLNVGDVIEFPVVVQNQTAEDMTVDVALRSSSTVHILETPGQRVTVPAADRAEVRFLVGARTPGHARIHSVAASGSHGDAALSTLPVLTPATTEDFATYGSLVDDDLILQPLHVPRNAFPGYGGLDIQTSSTRLQTLTDAFLYLLNHDFNSTEHLASRILSVLALYEVLDAFEAPDLPSPQAIRQALTEWTEMILETQLIDGGFGFWEGSVSSWPFVSVHAAHAIWHAHQAGVEVPPRALENAIEYVSNIDEHLERYAPSPARISIEAYSLYIRNRMRHVPAREVDQFFFSHGIEDVSLETLGWLLPVLEGTQWEERALERILNHVHETPSTAEFHDTYGGDAYKILHTRRRTDAVILDGLLQTDPDHYLVEKIVQGLLSRRERGRWSNTQENVFVLMALKRYFDLYEDDEPDFIARAWLGPRQIGEHQFSGRTTDRDQTTVPMAYLHLGEDEQSVVLQRDGEGRMYYRMGVRYSPVSRDMAALDQGFLVERVYTPIEDDHDIRRTDDGWEIRPGARVRVDLTVTIPSDRRHVALVDWLPAGLEPVDSAPTGSSRDELDGIAATRWWWRQTGEWVQHENLRDERVEVFASYLSRGVYSYSYIARATTPGEFVAMPARAEEMYHPDTFGRSATEVVRIMDR